MATCKPKFAKLIFLWLLRERNCPPFPKPRSIPKPLLVLDLSVPKNVSDDVKELDNVTLVHLDQLSQITDENLAKRKEYVPKAEAIIEKVKKDFLKWLETRKFAPVINALKDKLNTMKSEEIDFQTKKLKDLTKFKRKSSPTESFKNHQAVCQSLEEQ